MNTFQSFSTTFLHFCEHTRQLDQKTLNAYSIDLSQFDSFLRSQDLSYHEKASLKVYLEFLHSRYAPATVKRKLATLKAFFHYLEREELSANPFHSLDTTFREPQRLPRYIPLHIIQTLIRAVQKEYTFAKSDHAKKYSLRDLAVIELLFSTGIRISELCLLPAVSIDLEAMEMKILGKGSKERLLQLEASVIKTLRDYRDFFQNDIQRDGYFFISRRGGHLSDQSVRYMLNCYMKKSGSHMHITPHMFRHTFAKSLLEQDVDIRIIQPILGHSSITTTERYTYVSSTKQKQVLQDKNPLSLLDLNEKNEESV